MARLPENRAAVATQDHHRWWPLGRSCRRSTRPTPPRYQQTAGERVWHRMVKPGRLRTGAPQPEHPGAPPTIADVQQWG
eukprot:7546927-Alexandrium_andersonii.AAC.1